MDFHEAQSFFAGPAAGESLQKGRHPCRRLSIARASPVGAALDSTVSAQAEQLQSLQHIINNSFGDLSEGLETPVQLIYLLTLLGFLVVGAYLVVRQV